MPPFFMWFPTRGRRRRWIGFWAGLFRLALQALMTGARPGWSTASSRPGSGLHVPKSFAHIALGGSSTFGVTLAGTVPNSGLSPEPTPATCCSAGWPAAAWRRFSRLSRRPNAVSLASGNGSNADASGPAFTNRDSSMRPGSRSDQTRCRSPSASIGKRRMWRSRPTIISPGATTPASS